MGHRCGTAVDARTAETQPSVEQGGTEAPATERQEGLPEVTEDSDDDWGDWRGTHTATRGRTAVRGKQSKRKRQRRKHPELARIALAAGLPQDMLQVVQGRGADVGAALVAHPGIRMISFTGGTTSGRAIARVAGDRLVPAALELGGKSPHVVFADANRTHAVAAVVAGIFGSAGQSCVAGSRLFIEQGIYDEVLEQVVARAKGLRLALPDAEGVEMGPLASFHHRERVAAFVERARAEGGRVLCGGAAPTGTDPSSRTSASTMAWRSWSSPIIARRSSRIWSGIAMALPMIRRANPALRIFLSI